MRDVAIRGFRTFVQAFIGVFLALTVTTGVGDVPDVNALKRAGLAALWAAFVAILSWAQNAFEEGTGKNLLPK